MTDIPESDVSILQIIIVIYRDDSNALTTSYQFNSCFVLPETSKKYKTLLKPVHMGTAYRVSAHSIRT